MTPTRRQLLLTMPFISAVLVGLSKGSMLNGVERHPLFCGMRQLLLGRLPHDLFYFAVTVAPDRALCGTEREQERVDGFETIARAHGERAYQRPLDGPADLAQARTKSFGRVGEPAELERAKKQLPQV